MLKIIGNSISSFSNKVRFTANALHLNFDYQELNLAQGESRTPGHKLLHPGGKVPVLVDGDFVLFESDAIIRYLADRENSPLYPKGLRERAIVDQWMQFASTLVSNAYLKVFFNVYLVPKRNLELDSRSLKEGHGFLARHLPVLEGQFEKTPYLAGNQMTLADINAFSLIDPMDQIQIDLSPYPKIIAFRDRMRREPFYQKTFPEGFQLP